jgi:hypothetical protein
MLHNDFSTCDIFQFRGFTVYARAMDFYFYAHAIVIIERICSLQSNSNSCKRLPCWCINSIEALDGVGYGTAKKLQKTNSIRGFLSLS